MVEGTNEIFANLIIDKKMDCSPSEIALTNIVEAKMKMIKDALPSTIINFLTTCCPIKAATVATSIK